MVEASRYFTPTNNLEFVVVNTDNFTLGFSGFNGHTHGDVLRAEYELEGINLPSNELAVSRFIEELLEDKIHITLFKQNEKIKNISFSIARPKPRKYLEHGETEEFTIWSRL